MGQPLPGEAFLDRLGELLEKFVGVDVWKTVLSWCLVGALLGLLVGIWPGRPDLLTCVVVGAGGALYLIGVLGLTLGAVYLLGLLWLGAFALGRFVVRRTRRPV